MKSKIFAIQIELVTKLHTPEKRFCPQFYTVSLGLIHTYVADANASKVSMHWTINLVLSRRRRKPFTFDTEATDLSIRRKAFKEKNKPLVEKENTMYYKENYNRRRSSDDLGIFVNSKKKKTNK